MGEEKLSGGAIQVVVVTGAASGIGYAIAAGFAKEGHRVAIVDLDEAKATDSAARLSEVTESRTFAVAADVADRNSCRVAHEKIATELGAVSVLVNNAGIMAQKLGRIEELPPEYFDQMLAVHVYGAVNWARLVVPGMRDAGFGRIINISSANALLAVPHRLGYVTAKKALLGITEALALETARAGITVNAIVPGYIATQTLLARADSGVLDKESFTERTPVGRWGREEEIAHAATFLAQPESGFITGATLAVDGGITIRGDPNENLDFSPFADSDI